MANYAQVAANAARSIAQSGFVLPITHTVNGTYNPITGEDEGSYTVSGEFPAITTPARKSAVAQNMSFDDATKEGLVKGKIRFFLVAASGTAFAPEAGDMVEFKGSEWRILGVTPLEPDGTTPILYNIGVELV